MAKKEKKPLRTVQELMEFYFPKGERHKDPIKLRGKKLASSVRLYLELYKNGSRSYQYLDYWLTVEKDEKDKEKNLETYEIAKTILYERIADYNKKGAGFVSSNRGKVNLIGYIEKQAEEALKRSGNKHSYYATLLSLAKHIEAFSGKRTQLNQVDKDYLLRFIDYLRTAKNQNFKRTGTSKDKDVAISPNTQHNYFNVSSI